MKYYGLNLLRGLAAFGIVGCHLNFNPLTKVGKVLMAYTDMNVGVFGAISGFLLAMGMERRDKNSVLNSIFHKGGRLLPIYIFWTIFYVLAALTFDVAFEGGINHGWKHYSYWLSVVLRGGASCHLWYVIDLFYVSCIVILIDNALTKFARNKIIAILASVVLIVASTHSSSSMVFGYYFLRLFAFVLLGWWLYWMREYIDKLHILVLALMVVLVIIARPLCVGVTHKFLLDYACAIPFLLVAMRTNFPKTIIGEFLGAQSLGIYLVHPIVAVVIVMVAKKLFTSPYNGGELVVVWMIVYAISMAVTLAIKRISWISKVVK